MSIFLFVSNTPSTEITLSPFFSILQKKQQTNEFAKSSLKSLQLVLPNVVHVTVSAIIHSVVDFN